MSKLISFILIIAVMVGNVFAGGSSESKTSSISPSVEFLNDKMAKIDYSFRQSLEQTVEEVSGIDLTITAFPDVASYQTTIQQSIGSDKAPGLLTWWTGSQLEDLANSGALADLTELWNTTLVEQGVPASLAEPFTFNGKIYAVPFSVLYTSVYYNKKVFDELCLSEPKTVEEFFDICDALLAAGITPIALKNDSWAGFLWFQQILASYDPQLYRDVCEGKVNYDDKRVEEAMNVWKTMVDKGYFSSIYAADDCRRMLATGQIGMMLEDNQMIRNLSLDYGQEPGVDFDAFIFPGANGNNPTIFIEEAPLCVGEHSTDKATAMQVLQSWFTEPIQQNLYSGFGVLGNSSLTMDNIVFNKILSFTTDAENYNVIPRYYEYCPQNIRDTTLDAFMRFQMGNSTVNEMLKTCQAAADAYWK